MRNDFGTRPYKSRFPYKSGKSVKKQTADDKKQVIQQSGDKKKA